MGHRDISAELEFVGSIIKDLRVSNTVASLPNPSHIGVQFGSTNSEVTRAVLPDDGERYECALALFVNLTVFDGTSDTAEKKEISSIKLAVEGHFRGPVGDEQDFLEQVKINGLATLISIARAEIMTVSAQVYLDGKITMPLINVYEYYKNIQTPLENKTTDEQ